MNVEYEKPTKLKKKRRPKNEARKLNNEKI